MELQKILEQVKAVAREAGLLAQEKKITQSDIHSKGAADYVTETDLAVNRFVSERLLALLPGSGIVSEEEPAANTDAQYLWVLDPIDGTSNLIFDLRMSAVSICLLHGGEPVLGVVYNPFSQELFSAIKGGGAFLGDEPIAVNAMPTLEASLIGVGTTPYNRKKAAEHFAAIQRVFLHSLDIRRSGSAALDICYVACGRLSGFFEHQLSVWDFAGGAIVLTEAGGKITDFADRPLRFDGRSGIVATNAHIHAELLWQLQG